MIRKDYGAPWDKKVKVITLAVAAILITVPFLTDGIYSILPIALLLGCLLFSIRGYSLRDGKLVIHRLGWSNSFDLAKLTEIEVNPQAMAGSIRLFGNGGLFGFMGYFRNSILGKYRAFVTATEKCVVMKFGDQTIVISPDHPAELEQAIGYWLEHMDDAEDSASGLS